MNLYMNFFFSKEKVSLFKNDAIFSQISHISMEHFSLVSTERENIGIQQFYGKCRFFKA